jgi:hypothetical protein
MTFSTCRIRRAKRNSPSSQERVHCFHRHRTWREQFNLSAVHLGPSPSNFKKIRAESAMPHHRGRCASHVRGITTGQTRDWDESVIGTVQNSEDTDLTTIVSRCFESIIWIVKGDVTTPFFANKSWKPSSMSKCKCFETSLCRWGEDHRCSRDEGEPVQNRCGGRLC